MQRFIIIFENNLKLMLIKNSFELIIAEDLTSDPPHILYWWKRNGDQRFWKSWSWVIVISVVSKSFLRHLEPSTNVVLRETWLEFHDFSFNDHWIIRIDKSLIYWKSNTCVHHSFQDHFLNMSLFIYRSFVLKSSFDLIYFYFVEFSCKIYCIFILINYWLFELWFVVCINCRNIQFKIIRFSSNFLMLIKFIYSYCYWGIFNKAG